MVQTKSRRSGRSGSSAGGKRAASKKAGTGNKKAATKTKKKSSSKTAGPSSTGTARTRGSGKRDLLKTPAGNFFARRDGEGQFREMDEVGRSLAADRRRKAKTKVSSGYGDRGDR
jgi:hypothetical protein